MWSVMISGYDRLIIKVGLLMWSNKCDTVSLKKHETRWSLGLTGIGMDFIRFWEAEPEIGRDSLDFWLCKDKTRWFPSVIACKPGVPYSIAFAYASQFPVIFYSYQDNKNKKNTYFPKRHQCSLISPPYSAHLLLTTKQTHFSYGFIQIKNTHFQPNPTTPQKLLLIFFIEGLF